MDLSNEKKLLRTKMRSIRENLNPEEVKEGSLIICEKLKALNEIKKATRILVYKHVDNEVDISEFIEWCLKLGKTVYFPFIHEIKIGKYSNPGDLIKVGKYYEPMNTSSDIPEVALLPGLAFSLDGYRLGQGQGWYDMYLENKEIYKIGLCFQNLVIESIPHTNSDIKVNKLITNVGQR